MTVLAAYLLLFVAIGVGFIFVHLLAGKFIRPNKPDAAKRTIYECGEPTIGSSWIQFDLRFYVVALLFVIFDVEVAFFFPWAVVFGKANTVVASAQPSSSQSYQEFADRTWELVPLATRAENGKDAQYDRLREGKPEDVDTNARTIRETRTQARKLSWLALVEIAVFFGVLLVGYAYLWRRGDLAWVRSLAAELPSGEASSRSSPLIRPSAAAPRSETVAHS